MFSRSISYLHSHTYIHKIRRNLNLDEHLQTFLFHIKMYQLDNYHITELPWSLKPSDAEVTKRLLVEQGVSHLRDGQQRTPGVRFGIWGTVGPIPAADDPTACWCWGWWCGGWYKALLLLVLLSGPMPMPIPVPVPTADGGVLQPKELCFPVICNSFQVSIFHLYSLLHFIIH